MTTLEKLTAYFERFPGVGARQAKRFAFHVLTLPEHEASEIGGLISALRGSVVECTECHRFFTRHEQSRETACAICTNPNRDPQTLLVVTQDNDVTVIERSGVYNGLYFVLGGTVPLLSEPETKRLRSGALKQTVVQRCEQSDLSEIIFGFPVNPDGENTSRYVEQLLQDSITEHNITVSQLGRGLSTGSELEYADAETIKNALHNRTH